MIRLIASTFFLASVLTWSGAADPPPPNVVLFMADDMGMGDTSAYQDFTGNTDAQQIHTPAMEKLARAGVRFTDAHTPSSRCSPTRYGLLTGRYPWRNRLKHFVLFGSQGDPTIEADRPTLGTLFQSAGYRTGLVGKWHVGLRYRRSDGTPAAGFLDADLTKPLLDGPLQHGFHFARFTSRSHGTSGPDPSASKNKKKGKNTPEQNVGPGHIHGDRLVSATGNGRQLVAEGADAYLLDRLGSRHVRHAIEFMGEAVAGKQPFFLYYPSNCNHGPYTPDVALAKPGSGRSKGGEPMGKRYDYLYENDAALGRLLDYLEKTDDPRSPGKKLVANTIVIFTSDNGAEIKAKTATGPFRSNKGSCYEGGHRVPYIVSWPAGGIAGGKTSKALVNLVDLYATFAEILGEPLPDLREGEKGAEDSISSLPAWRGESLPPRPHFYHDHKEAGGDKAVLAMRFDNDLVSEKIFFDHNLIRRAVAKPIEYYDFSKDHREQSNLIDDAKYASRVEQLTMMATFFRRSSGLRAGDFYRGESVTYDWRDLRQQQTKPVEGLKLDLQASTDKPFHRNERGLGITGGEVKQIDSGEALLIKFSRDVLVESVGIIAGNGQCGGFYRVGDGATLNIYCLDAHIDSHDQSGLITDVGVLKAGQVLCLDSTPHHQNEAPGRWRLASLTVRPLEPSESER